MNRWLYSVEGNTQRLDGGAMFGNAPKSLWERWAPPDERNRIELACRAMLVREDTRWILFEVGIGSFFDPKLRDRYGVDESNHVLLDNLANLGVSHEDIGVVVLSHLHFDHAGGLLTPWEPDIGSRLLFPKATYVVGREAWDRACNPHVRDKASFIPEIQELLDQSGRLEIVDGPISDTLGVDYQIHRSDGHTPGLMMVEVPGVLGGVVFASDLIPGRAWVHRSITMGYDRFPELLVDEKTRLMDDLVARNGRLFFTHDPTCALARVTRDEKGRYGSVQGKARLTGELA